MTKDPLFIVFDCDGTLADSQHHIVDAMRRAWGEAGLSNPPSDHNIRQIIGLKLHEAIAQLDNNLSDEQVDNIAKFYGDICRQASDDEIESPLFEGIKDEIIKIHNDGHILGVATGKGRRGLNAFLHFHELNKYFTILKTADDGPGKPNPLILQQAMDEVAAPPHHTFMIGDTSFDMLLAKNADCYAIGVDWGYHSRDILIGNGADIVLESADYILQSCKNILAQKER